MACPEFEDRILETLEASPAPGAADTSADPAAAAAAAGRADLEAHLATCEACREFAQAQRLLDAQLQTAFSQPRLPTDFARRVLRAVDAQTPAASPEWRAERRRAIETEYQARLRRKRGWVLGLRTADWMELLGWGVGAGCAAVAFVKCQALLPALIAQLPSASRVRPEQWVPWAAAAVSLIALWAWLARFRRSRL
jgi:hypothetical protein